MRLVLSIVRMVRYALDLGLVLLVGVVVGSLLLARAVPAITGAPVFVVGGGSMEPAIHLGSVAVDVPVAAADLAVGDVVSLQVGPQLAVFTHRITRLVPRADGLWVETKGDANRTIDPSIIPATAVLGRVAVTVPLLGFVIQMLASASGLLLLFMLGVVGLAGTWALELVEEELGEASVPRLRPVRVHAVLRDRRTDSGVPG